MIVVRIFTQRHKFRIPIENKRYLGQRPIRKFLMKIFEKRMRKRDGDAQESVAALSDTIGTRCAADERLTKR